MSEYIKKEDAIKEANTWSMFGNEDLESRLKRLPSADVVEVVRCKDCKFYDTDNDTGFPLCRRLGDIVMKPTDYCSYGERKENE